MASGLRRSVNVNRKISPHPRTRVIVGLAAGLVVGAVVALSALAAARSGLRRPYLTERRIVQIAERAAAAAGDRRPTLIQHSEGTRQRANAIASGDRVDGNRWSYLIAERGLFVLKSVSVPPGARAPRGSVLTLVVDAATSAVSDLGVSDHYPDLAALGAVSTDLRQPPPVCLQKAPGRLPIEVSFSSTAAPARPTSTRRRRPGSPTEGSAVGGVRRRHLECHAPPVDRPLLRGRGRVLVGRPFDPQVRAQAVWPRGREFRLQHG